MPTPFNILIVDDSATTRAMIKRTIQLSQVPVANLFEAGHGQEALEVLEHVRVDLVLADLNMPQMNGIELTQRMRGREEMRDIPVIVVSADPNARHHEALRESGIQGYVRKPFTPESVRDTINAVLGVAHA